MIQTYHLLDGGQITASRKSSSGCSVRGADSTMIARIRSIWRTLPGVTGSCMACQLPPIPLNIS